MSTLTDDELIEQVRVALQRRAGDVRDVAARFDPTRPDFQIPMTTTLRKRRPRSTWARVAAAVLVMVGVAAAVAVTRSGDRSKVGLTSSSGALAPPDASNVPTGLASQSAPDGTRLWSIAWSQQASDPLPTRTELFGRPDGQGAKVLIQVTPGNPGSSGCCTPIDVRNQAAQIGPAKEFPDTTSDVTWQEDASLEAKFNGMSQTDALAFLDALQWRSADHFAGLDAAPGSTLTLLEEVVGDPPSTLAATLELRYRDQAASIEPAAGVQREVRASAGPGHKTSRYLKTWFDGRVDADGVARSYETTFGTYAEAAPDGRYVWIDANNTPSSEAALRAIADGIAPRTGVELLALRSEAEASAASLPLVATITLPSGDVEVRGDAAARALCLHMATVERCTEPAPDITDTSGPLIGNVGSFLIHNEWFVVYASMNDPQITSGHPAPPYTRDHPDVVTPLPSEKNSSGDWHAVLGRPPASLQKVQIADGNQLSGDILPPAF